MSAALASWLSRLFNFLDALAAHRTGHHIARPNSHVLKLPLSFPGHDADVEWFALANGRQVIASQSARENRFAATT